jgi:hypothetical protein
MVHRNLLFGSGRLFGLEKVRVRDDPFVTFAACRLGAILSAFDFTLPNNSMKFLTSVFSSMPPLWWVALTIPVLGIAAICLRALESDESRAKRAERNKKKELRSMAQRISSYGHTVHQRWPTGDVIVSERDLAEEFRKRPDVVITALNLLLTEQKVQRAPLRGYWKLNV